MIFLWLSSLVCRSIVNRVKKHWYPNGNESRFASLEIKQLLVLLEYINSFNCKLLKFRVIKVTTNATKYFECFYKKFSTNARAFFLWVLNIPNYWRNKKKFTYQFQNFPSKDMNRFRIKSTLKQCPWKENLEEKKNDVQSRYKCLETARNVKAWKT